MAKSLAKVGIPTNSAYGAGSPMHVSMAASADCEYIAAVSTGSCDGYIYKSSQLWQGAVQCLFRHTTPLLALDWQPTLNICIAMGSDGTLCAAKLSRQLKA